MYTLIAAVDDFVDDFYCSLFILDLFYFRAPIMLSNLIFGDKDPSFSFVYGAIFSIAFFSGFVISD